MNLSQLRNKTDQLLQQYQHARLQVKEEKQALREAEALVLHVEEAQAWVQQVAQGVQQQAHTQIGEVVTRCLQAVFPDPYEFRIIFERKRHRTEARLVFLRDGMEFNPLKSSGGGVIDVAAFALRLVCLSLTKPKRRRLFCPDEPFRYLNPVYYPLIPQMLKVLSKEMDTQFIMISNIPQIQTGKVIDLGELL